MYLLYFSSFLGVFLAEQNHSAQVTPFPETFNFLSLWGYKAPALPHPKQTILKCHCNIWALQRKYWACQFSFPLLFPLPSYPPTSAGVFFPRRTSYMLLSWKIYLWQVIFSNNCKEKFMLSTYAILVCKKLSIITFPNCYCIFFNQKVTQLLCK